MPAPQPRMTCGEYFEDNEMKYTRSYLTNQGEPRIKSASINLEGSYGWVNLKNVCTISWLRLKS